jgi:hypothetical protein
MGVPPPTLVALTIDILTSAQQLVLWSEKNPKQKKSIAIFSYTVYAQSHQ